MTLSSSDLPQSGASNDPSHEEYELRHYVRVLWHRKLTIIVPIIVCIFAGIAVSGGSPKFSSATQILVQPAITTVGGAAADRSSIESIVATEMAIMRSDAVSQAVAEEVGHPVAVSIAPLSQESNVVTAAVSARDRTRVRDDAQAFAETYVEVRRQQLASALEEASEQVTLQRGTVEVEIAALAAPIADLDAQIIATTDAVTRNGLENQREELLSQRNALEARRSAFQDQLDGFALTAAVNPTFGITVLSDAPPPARANKGQKRQYAVAGGAVGLLLGVLLAFIREYFNNRIRTRRDFERSTPGARLLAVIPKSSRFRPGGAPTLVARDAPGSAKGEAYRRLRTALRLTTSQTSHHAFVVTSANAEEGRTSVAANVAISLSSMGARVLLIDANLRRPKIHSLFGVPNDVGLVSVIVGGTPVGESTHAVPDLPHLRVLTSGPEYSDPATLFSSTNAARVFADARAAFDFVIIDGPPLLPVTDGIALALLVDGAVFVARANATPSADVEAALELLRDSGVRLVGTVLNCATSGDAHLATYRDRRGRSGSPAARLPGRSKRAEAAKVGSRTAT